MAHARNVLILGGGASGTLLAIQMLRAKSDAHITLIERTEAVGKGIAYGSAHPIHLLNVRAANMSAYPDIPDHFSDWLDKQQSKASAADDKGLSFASRLAFGNYLTSELEKLRESPGSKDRFTHIQGEAASLVREANGIAVTLDNYRRVKGDVAVIATGYEPPVDSNFSLTATPWLGIDRVKFAKTEDILLLGTGLSTIDHIQSLIAAGYQGRIIAISRRGLLPQAHRPVDPADIQAEDVPYGQSLSKTWRWFRTQVGKAESNGSDWRAVLDGLRPYVQTLWREFSPDAQSRFVRHARPWWDVRRHRMAPQVAAAMADLIANGRLVVIPAKIASITPKEEYSGSIEVRFRRRGKTTIETLMVQSITDCTGFSIDVTKTTNPLIRSLLNQKLAKPDRLGLGLDVDQTSALIAHDGKPARDLFAVGPLTRGAFWEITGIPDIRNQCARLSQKLLNGDPTNGTISSEASSTPESPSP